jgi:CheY-like chemotaxis protein
LSALIETRSERFNHSSTIRTGALPRSPQRRLILTQKVFEPFFTTKAVGSGTGLGLSQVYGFARAAGGDVRFESELGKGSIVSILLPCCDKPLPAEPVAAATPAEEVQERSRILLVEDDDQVADLVGEMLSELGYDFVRAGDAAAALEQLSGGGHFDLVFSDMVMPGAMGGLELAQEIARRWPNLKVVLTSGYSQAAASAVAEGREILAKPYTIQALGKRLSDSLGRC